MELRNLKTFYIVSKYLNFTKSANILGYTQPTISIHIQMLEKEIGFKLFKHIGNQTFLTPAGEILKTNVDRIFLILDQLNQNLNELRGASESLIIAAPESYCIHYLSTIVSVFLKNHPEVNLQLNARNTNEVIDLLDNKKADIGIIAGPLSIKKFKTILLEREDCLLITSRKLYQKYGKDTLLNKFPFISYKVKGNYKNIIDTCLNEIGYHPPKTIKFDNEETIKHTLINDLGISILSATMCKSEIESGSLIAIHRFHQKLQTVLICLKGNVQNSTVNTFLKLVHKLWNTIP